MALQNFINVSPKQFLPTGLHRSHKRRNEPEVAATVPATFLRRPDGVRLRRARAEVGDGELGHVADDLAVREVQARLALADRAGEGDHREGHGRAGAEREVHDLVVHDVVGALVHALPVWPRLQRGGDVLDVGDAVDERADGPAGLSGCDAVEVDCGRSDRSVRMTWVNSLVLAL